MGDDPEQPWLRAFRAREADGGAEGARLLADAVAAYRAALEVRTREELPQDWAMTQNNLGTALQEQGTRTGGAEGARLLADAVAAYRAVIEALTREELPQQWAGTQNNLGSALLEQGTRTGGTEGAQLLADAAVAYRAALQVYTSEHLTYYHDLGMGNLSRAEELLRELAGAGPETAAGEAEE